ncbi:MAG: glycosyltransferase [Bacteroidales bacterium]|nr:glycosyltransferase [Bacteroidales bacterium]
MKKILCILASTVLYGKERSNIEVYNLLRDTGDYDITIVLSDKADDKLRKAVESFRVIEFDFADRHDRTLSKWQLLKKIYRSNKELKEIFRKEKADILFVNSEMTIDDMYFAFMSFKGKVIYRIGDAPSYEGRTLRFLNRFIWKSFCINKVDTFVCISKFIKNRVEATGRVSLKDVIIYNYPPTRNTIGKDESSLYKNRKQNGITFGYIGQIGLHKGVIELVSAFKQLKKNSDCLLYMAGSLKYSKRAPNKIRNIMGDSSNIVLLDEIEDVELFFNNIDVLCVPSVKEEPLGNVIVEAKKFGKPCIIFPSGGMPELITHKKDGFVCCEKTTDALLEGLEWYYDNRDLLSDHNVNSFNSIQELGIDRVNFESKWLAAFNNL